MHLGVVLRVVIHNRIVARTEIFYLDLCAFFCKFDWQVAVSDLFTNVVAVVRTGHITNPLAFS